MKKDDRVRMTERERKRIGVEHLESCVVRNERLSASV